MTFVKGYFRDAQHRRAFVATTKALAAHVMSEREWNAFVGEVLAMEVDDVLAEPLDGLDMDEAMKTRVRESM